ncbi:MAG TPA: 2-keto-4-pentenoate hydratase [Thermopolyspora sp.]
MNLHERLADELWTAARKLATVPPISDRYPDFTLDDAYAVQHALLARHFADGATIAGHKIGATSDVIKRMFHIDHPDFGFVSDRMLFPDKASVAIGDFIAPKVEGEIAFRMADDLAGEDVTAQDVLVRTAELVPVIEILDSRIENWRIQLVDTVADNASCGGVVVGTGVPLDGVDLPAERVEFTVGEVTHEAFGSAVLGHPAEAVAWLARMLSRYGNGIRAGELVLAGAWAEAADLVAGATTTAAFGTLGSVTLLTRAAG